MNVLYQLRLLIIGVLVANTFTGCKKLVEIPPPVSMVTESTVFTVDATAIAVLSGIYNDMTKVIGGGGFTGSSSIAILAGLSADEFTLHNGVSSIKFLSYYKNELGTEAPNIAGAEFWQSLYQFIFRCNAAIEGLQSEEAINNLTGIVRKQLLGEAKFMRAFFYFYLINLYGSSPMVIGTDYNVNRLLPRVPVQDIVRFMGTDLEDAYEFLSANYTSSNLISSTNERVRPTRWAAAALQARLSLFSENWTKAEETASIVINQSSFFSLPALNNVFLKNSSEAIWQLQPTALYFNTEDARTLIIPATGPSNSSATNPANPVYLSPWMLGAFEAGDRRRENGNWVSERKIGTVTYYYPFKYKKSLQDTTIKTISDLSEYLMVFRLAEQFLIRAEARVHQGNLDGARADLDKVRLRAGLPGSTATSAPELLLAIAKERQVELFTEWGHRWLDLKRTNTVDEVMSKVTPLKGGIWETTDKLYPLLLDDILKNPNLIQNLGY